VELSLLLPVLVFGLLGGADLARAYASQLAVQNAARAGAEAAAIGVASDTQVVTYARAELIVPGLNPTDAAVAVAHTTTSGVERVSVTVTYTWRTIVPWPIVPNRATFVRTVHMREWR
jgi:Flp pilus assembly protein TadG